MGSIVGNSLDDAVACHHRGDYERAEAICIEILARQPYHADALNLASAAALGRDRPTDALDYVDRAIKASAGVARYHHNRAVTLQILRRDQEAVDSYRAALMLAPGNKSAISRLRPLLVAYERLQEVSPPLPSSKDAPRPRVLALTTAIDGLAIARLPAILQDNGIDVATLCPRGSLLDRTRFVSERYRPGASFTIADILASLIDAVAAWRPALIIPGDELAVHILHALHQQQGPAVPPRVRALIARSCGDPLAYAIAKDKNAAVAAAAALGIPTPPSRPASTTAEVIAAAAAWGYPVVLKRRHGATGIQVRLCRDAQQVEAAIAELGARTMPALAPAAGAAPFQVQRFIDGTPVSVSFVAAGGKLLDSFAYAQAQATEPMGPASAIRHLPEPEPALDAAIQALVARFGFTGFGGIDFVVDPRSREMFFLEFNPRVTIASHLGRLFGHDLGTALHARLTGTAPRPHPPSPRADLVALTLNGADNPLLRGAHVDLPVDDPALLQGMADQAALAASSRASGG